MRFERRGNFGGGRRFGSDSGGRGFGGRSGGRDRFDDDQPKPVNVGEEYDVEVTETGSRGDGIARVKNFVVFIDGAKQGEKVKIKITDVRGRFALGKKVGDASEETASAKEGETQDVTEKEVEGAGEEGEEPASEEPASEETASEEETSEEETQEDEKE